MAFPPPVDAVSLVEPVAQREVSSTASIRAQRLAVAVTGLPSGRGSGEEDGAEDRVDAPFQGGAVAVPLGTVVPTMPSAWH